MRLFQYFQLIPALLLCCASSCAHAPAPNIAPPQNSFRGNAIIPIISLEESASDSTIEDEEYWDTKKIDISEIDCNRKLIAFTFDDAPSRTLESILAVFASFNEKNENCKASATVFFNSSFFKEDSSHLLYSALALGFEFGNHTHSHYDLTTLPQEKLIAEIDKTDALLQKIDGRSYHLLRAPFGKTNNQVKLLAKAPIIDWTIDTLDWTGASEQAIYDSVFNHRFSGAIVLMHDGYEGTVSALKRLLPDLMEDGYQVVSVSKMIKAHNCKFRNGSVYIRARKQN